MTTLVERAIEKVRSEPSVTKQEMWAYVNRACELFDGNTIWGGVRR